MAYYLGRDVKVYLTTESPESQVSVVSHAVSALGGGSGSGGSPTAGVSTITVTDTAEKQDDTIINITSGGTTITATETGTTTTTNTNSPTFAAAASSSGGARTAAAVNIATCLNAHTKLTATSSGYVVTITQVDKGTDGNTTISGTAFVVPAGASITTQFTGGNDGVVHADTIFAENLDEVLGAVDGLTRLANLTGVDLSIGVTDEDITFMSKKTVLKAEIKKETTITLTRKKSNNVWDVVYNGPTAADEGWTGSAAETGSYGARWGVIEGAADTWYVNNGLIAPKNATDFGGTDISFGYRVFIELKNSVEVISIPGCQLTGHTVTLSADGTQEETCELISHVTPKIGSALDYTRLTATDM